MIAHILYSKDSPAERECIDFARELERHQVQYRLVDADSREGQSLTELYDLPARPAVVLVRDDGTPVERWQSTLPLVTDISYLAHT